MTDRISTIFSHRQLWVVISGRMEGRPTDSPQIADNNSIISYLWATAGQRPRLKPLLFKFNSLSSPLGKDEPNFQNLSAITNEIHNNFLVNISSQTLSERRSFLLQPKDSSCKLFLRNLLRILKSNNLFSLELSNVWVSLSTLLSIACIWISII